MEYFPQSSLRFSVLAVLFAAAQTDQPYKTVSEIQGNFKIKIGSRRYDIAIEELIEEQLIDFADQDISGDDLFVITNLGYSEAEKAYLDKDSNFFSEMISSLLNRWSDKSGSKSDGVEVQLSVPAADRFVTISDNMPGYKEALDALEHARDQIRGSNNLDPEEKSWIQSNLEAGIDLVKKGGRILRSGLKTFIIEPLNAALKGESEDGLKSVIKIALAAIRTYFGL